MKKNENISIDEKIELGNKQLFEEINKNKEVYESYNLVPDEINKDDFKIKKEKEQPSRKPERLEQVKTVSFEFLGEPKVGEVTEEGEGYIKVTDQKGIKHTIKEGDKKYEVIETTTITDNTGNENLILDLL